ncbi:MAG: TlpA disulfide reductase family protein [Aquabacterium sp.]
MNRFLIVGMAALCLNAAHAANIGEAIDPATLNTLKVDPAKITVIDFFAEWCISCRKELPLISALHARSDQKKVEFIGVDTDDSIKAAQAFQKELRDKGMLGFRVLNDTDQALVKSFKPKGYPALYILKDGKVVREHLGATPNVDALLEQDLKALGAN